MYFLRSNCYKYIPVSQHGPLTSAPVLCYSPVFLAVCNIFCHSGSFTYCGHDFTVSEKLKRLWRLVCVHNGDYYKNSYDNDKYVDFGQYA
jgi:hypothetical protein